MTKNASSEVMTPPLVSNLLQDTLVRLASRIQRRGCTAEWFSDHKRRTRNGDYLITVVGTWRPECSDWRVR